MAQSARGGAVRFYSVGDFQLGNQIGAGSFLMVWHAHHRVHGTEVAIKEIVTARLNSKLQESLKSEIFILKRINHPNIIDLHDMIEIGWDSVMRMSADPRDLFLYEAFLYYNPLLLMTMMVWLWGINLWVFSQANVGYAKIFDLDQSHLTHKEIWDINL
ncbi:serine/threonine-protein kinase ATG1b-like [Primulina tabacum]|uniref:serine/threonine-protein kinase ATG1b-like n=1 Tax=Primulina tabacum TaxID=48773 RepID=UPI003F59E7E1